MKIKKANKILNYILPALAILVIFLIWFFAYKIVDDGIVLPGPIDTIFQTFKNLSLLSFWRALVGTLGRSAIAFVLSFMVAISLVILSRRSKNINSVVSVLISILRALPTIAVILMLLLWTTSKVAAVVVTMIVILPTVFSAVNSCFGSINGDIMQMFKLYKVPKSRQFKSYIIPTITPSLIETIGGGLSLNIKLMVASEVIAGTAVSIGQLMSQSKIYFETSILFSLVIIMIIISAGIELICNVAANLYRRKHGLRKD